MPGMCCVRKYQLWHSIAQMHMLNHDLDQVELQPHAG